MNRALDIKADVVAQHRDYDMIVVGATGFTGRRTARELINKYSATYRYHGYHWFA